MPTPGVVIIGDMSWLPPPPRRIGGLRARPPAPRPDAVHEMLQNNERESFENKTFGASAGEMLPPPDAQPPAQQSVGLTIEPPPWQDALDRGEIDLEALAPPERPPDELTALDKMKSMVEPFDPPAPGPPLVTDPAPPIRIPEADWSAEQKQRAERDPEPAAEPPGEPFIPPKPPWDPS